MSLNKSGLDCKDKKPINASCVLCPTCKHLGRGRVGDGRGILRNGAHIGLRGAAGWRDSQRRHHHPGFELRKEKFLHSCIYLQAYHFFTKSCRDGDGGIIEIPNLYKVEVKCYRKVILWIFMDKKTDIFP